MSELQPASNLATLSDVPGTELRQLQVVFDSFREFVERYAPWLSDACIFVETREQVAVGTPIRLEIWLRDRPALIRALGHVDWVRDPTADDEGPSGVALDITYIDPASARLIDSIFRLYNGQQGAPLDDSMVQTWELDVESLIDGAFPGDGGLSAEPAIGKPAESPSKSGPAQVAASPTAEPPIAEPEDDPRNTVLIPVLPPPADPEEDPRSTVVFPAQPMAPQPETDSKSTPDSEPMRTTQAPDPGHLPPIPSEEEWEERLSAAFSEHPVGSEHPVATDTTADFSGVGFQEPAAGSEGEGTSFGFGLVETPPRESGAGAQDPAGFDDPAMVSEPIPSPEATVAFSIDSTLIDPPGSPEFEADAAPQLDTSEPVASEPVVSEPAAFEPQPMGPTVLDPLETASQRPGDSVSKSVTEPGFLRRSAFLFLLAIVAGAALFLFLRSRSDIEPAPSETVASSTLAKAEPVPIPSERSAETDSRVAQDTAPVESSDESPSAAIEEAPEVEDVVTPAAAASLPSAVPIDTETIVREAEKVVKDWAAAWSEQDPDNYLAAYSPSYSPAGVGRREWEEQRRIRIAAPASILVLAKDIDVEVVDDSSAIVRFYQDYETDSAHLYTWKTMELARLDQSWRIVAERTGR